MNAVARAIAAQNIRARKKGVVRITATGIGVVVLVVALLLSAFTVVYAKDLNRRLFIQYQALQTDKGQALIEWGKLLLEQSTWSTQSRIQQIAERQLGMQVPNARDIVLVEDYDTNTTTR